MSRTNEELAIIHLETAVALKGVRFARKWLAEQQGPSSPTLPSGAASATSEAGTTHTTQSVRGRKPGAAAPEVRCSWTMKGGDKCKNGKIESSVYCKIHETRAAAIAAAAISETAENEKGGAPSPAV